MKRQYVMFAVVVIGMLWLAASMLAQAPTQPADVPYTGVDALMRAKLESAQGLLKAMTLEEYESVHQAAQRLELLSMDTDWNIMQTKDYVRLSGEFREAARQIGKSAENRNLDAAGLGYFKLTMTCIDCHRHMRIVQKK